MSLWRKSFGVTIQMKPLQQYFLMFLSNLQNEIGKFLLNFPFGYIASERVNDGTFYSSIRAK